MNDNIKDGITLTIRNKAQINVIAVMKCRLGILNQSLNRSLTRGELQVPPRPKKFRRAQSKVKKMMIFVYDHQRIMTDRVPCERSVTAVYYYAFMQKLRRKLQKN